MITIKVSRTGAYIIEGDDMAQVRLVDADGNEISHAGRKKISLCRCGASSTKPFCDSTHTKIGFLAAEKAAAELDAQKAAGGGVAGTPSDPGAT